MLAAVVVLETERQQGEAVVVAVVEEDLLSSRPTKSSSTLAESFVQMVEQAATVPPQPMLILRVEVAVPEAQAASLPWRTTQSRTAEPSKPLVVLAAVAVQAMASERLEQMAVLDKPA